MSPPSETSGSRVPTSHNPAEVTDKISRRLDRLNPVLVRDLQTWIRSKLLLLSIALGCIALLLVSTSGMQQDHGFANGMGVFDLALILVVPIVLLAVPLHAYQSMLEEMHEGVLDQLVLTGLSPRRIILGKAGSSLAQFFFFLSLLSPLMALAFVMRGVGIGLIAFYVGFSLLAAVSAALLAVLLATLARTKLLQSLGQFVILFGLWSATVGLMTEGMSDLRFEINGFLNEPKLPTLILCSTWAWICGAFLLMQCAAAMLAHPHENRSTGFRLFLPLLFVTGVISVLLMADPGGYHNALPGFAIMASLVVGTFGLFASTEQEKLSPRQRSLVPAHPSKAPLLAPYLPGRSRGLLFTLIWLMPSVLFATFTAELIGGSSPHTGMLNIAYQSAMYFWIYIALTYQLRKRLPERTLSNWMARGSFFLLLAAGCLLPLFYDLLVGTKPYREFGWHHLGNPFFVFAEGYRNLHLQYQIQGILAGISVLLAVLALSDFICAVKEVKEAAQSRRDVLRPVEVRDAT